MFAPMPALPEDADADDYQADSATDDASSDAADSIEQTRHNFAEVWLWSLSRVRYKRWLCLLVL